MKTSKLLALLLNRLAGVPQAESHIHALQDIVAADSSLDGDGDTDGDTADDPNDPPEGPGGD